MYKLLIILYIIKLNLLNFKVFLSTIAGWSNSFSFMQQQLKRQKVAQAKTGPQLVRNFELY